MPMWTISLICVVLVLRTSLCLPGDPTLTSDTVSDGSGNSADGDSVITWSGLPDGAEYKSSTVYDDKGLAVYYGMVKGFINTVQPNDFPYDMVTGVVAGTYDISTHYMEVVNYGLGFGICFALGFLFLLIMPIVGCCMCCCRTCCNKCGGKKIQKYNKNNKCKKIAFSIALFICTSFMIVGAACMLVTNDAMSTSLEDLVPSLSNSLGDAPVFVNHVIDDINHVALAGFNFTSAVLDRDLNSLGFLLGIPTRTSLDNAVNLDATIKSMKNFDQVINTVSVSMLNINVTIARLKTNGEILQESLVNLTNKVETAKTAINSSDPDTTDLRMDANYTSLPDISHELSLINDVQSQDFSSNVDTGKKQFDDIPWTVHNETQSMSKDIADMVGDVYDDIESGLSSLTSVGDSVSGYLDPITNDIEKMLEPVIVYEKYRWYGFLGLAALLLGIAFLQLIGLLCGGFGTCKDVPPRERGCIPNCGGNCLMAASAFSFIFFSLLMLFLSIMFLLGGNLEAIVCKPLTDPEYEIFSILEGPNGLIQKDGYILPGFLFGDKSIELPLAQLLKGCDQNNAAFSALQLYRKFDIDNMLDWKKHVNLDSEIDKLDVDFSDVEIITDDTKNQLLDFKSAVNIDYQGFVDELSKNTTAVDLLAFEMKLTALNRSEFDDSIAYVQTIRTGIYEDVLHDQSRLLQDIEQLNISTQSVPETVDDLIASAEATQSVIHQNASEIVKQEARVFQKRTESIIDSFVGYANNSIFNDIGKCQPLTNMYKSLVDVTTCQSIVGVLNGYWFGLGICLFFMIPSIIFSIKLAKHFRRMKYSEEDDKPPSNEETNNSPPPPYGENTPPPGSGKNKIYPVDDNGHLFDFKSGNGRAPSYPMHGKNKVLPV